MHKGEEHGPAAKLVAIGFDEIIPLRRGKKIPALKGWSVRGPASTEEARSWDRRPANIGMLAKNYPAIDIDVDDAQLTARIVKLARRMLGDAPVRIRASRALLVYRTRVPFPKRKLRFSREDSAYAVEVLGDGQQYLVHGDKSGDPYEWLEKPLYDTGGPEDLTLTTHEEVDAFLEALRELLAEEGWEISASTGTQRGDLPDQSSLQAPSIEKLREVMGFIPNGPDWDDRDKWLKMIVALRGAGGAENEMEARQIAADWSADWEGDGPASELREKAEQTFDSFDKGVKLGWSWILDQARERGYSDAVESFDATDPPPPGNGNPRIRALQELNEKYAVVQVGKDVRVLQEWDDGDISLLSQADFRFKYANRLVPSGAPGNQQPIASAWINWPGRRQYERLVFKPGELDVPASEYNLWRGWDVDASPSGSCDKFLQHLRDIVCDGDEDAYEWFLDFLADIIQNPQSKPGVAVALQGGQGAGKTLVGAVMKRLLGRYHLMADKANQVVGNFNSHLRHCLMLQCEEAFWGGSKHAEGALKHLVTSEYLLIEQKGIDSVEMKNFTRVVITSNEAVVWPTSIDDRRLAIFKVSSSRVGDAAYFDAIFDELDDGGYEHFMYVLRTREIDHRRLRIPPRTAALETQAAESLSPEERWLRSLLESGEIAGEVGEDGSVRIPLAVLYDEYCEALPRRAYVKNEPAFASFVQDHLEPTKTGERPRVRTRRREKVRSTIYVIPPLPALRARYSRRGRGAPQEWEQPEQWTQVSIWGDPFESMDGEPESA